MLPCRLRVWVSLHPVCGHYSPLSTPGRRARRTSVSAGVGVAALLRIVVVRHCGVPGVATSAPSVACARRRSQAVRELVQRRAGRGSAGDV
jgi:hypothetical protein